MCFLFPASQLFPQHCHFLLPSLSKSLSSLSWMATIDSQLTSLILPLSCGLVSMNLQNGVFSKPLLDHVYSKSSNNYLFSQIKNHRRYKYLHDRFLLLLSDHISTTLSFTQAVSSTPRCTAVSGPLHCMF